MPATGTTASELLTDIDNVIGSKTQPNTITPATHSDLLNNMVKVLSGVTSGGGGSELTTTVTITAAEFIAAAAGPNPSLVKEILPAPGSGKIYKINEYIGFQKNATIPFDGSPSLQWRGSDISSPYLALIGSTSVSLATIFPPDTQDQVVMFGHAATTRQNEPLNLIKNFGTAPTVGDGDVIMEIKYEIIDL